MARVLVLSAHYGQLERRIVAEANEVEPVEVVGAEVGAGFSGLEHVVDDDEERMGDRHEGASLAETARRRRYWARK